MRKVLVISYYWPPSGGAGVQRWLKFVKYLRHYGWEPVVYTPENPEPPSFDDSLSREVPEDITVIKQPIWEPYDFYRKLIGARKDERINAGFLSETRKPGSAHKFSVWLRGNFFIPDARKFWIRPSVKFLTKFLKDHPVDALISTGPPHSMHMIALGVKKKTGLPWLADFRDPWTNIDFYDQLMLSRFADHKHRRMEQQVIKHADRLVTVSRSWETDFKRLGASRTEVITNGYDPADFPEIPVLLPESFTITHIGSLNRDRNPDFLWKVLGEMVETDDAFRRKLQIRFVGKTDISVFESLEHYRLREYAVKTDYLPHGEALKVSATSAVLLLLINNTPNAMGIIPGKVFEYLASRRPVLCIGPPEGDSAGIIRETRAGEIVDFGDEKSLKMAIDGLFESYQQRKLPVPKDSINKFSRKSLTGDIARILNEITKRENA
ncbi:glycosyltransferase family 4 protein [Lentimicrobium sp.]|uniref:glycosyltransferase family 4 protein n=1 Tax=Lentimicrobium sp. TaxID=2034841 RepID=UPI002C3A0550|nr:glycosyltransferase family 4 protein [Lentimicrobium sp.]HRW69748.1 glycosyltransferase family 4 protein [Lentimicrobium sp.]